MKMPRVSDDAPTVEVSVDRYGYRIDGTFRRRVTTHLRGIPKPWLAGWAAKAVAGFAVEHRDRWLELPPADAVKLLKGSPWSQRDAAGDRGAAVHEAIHAHVEGRPLPDTLKTEDELDCAIAAEAWLNLVDPVILGAEVTVYSDEYDYAGTLDLWCVIDGVPWIIDWKTSSGVYVEHAVQQVAYRHADHAIVSKEPLGKDRWKGRLIPWGPDRAERLGIVHVRPDGAELHPIAPAEVDEMWRVFRAAKYMKRWQDETDSYRGRPDRRVYDETRYEVRTKQADDGEEAA